MSDPAAPHRPSLSVVTPAYNEARNLTDLYRGLSDALDDSVRCGVPVEWEWIVVDDGSGDGTCDVVARLAAADSRVSCLRLARNGGSHAAIARGLATARGDAVLVLAGDLQDPPELAPGMLAKWRAGARVVWAVRRERSDGRLNDAAARLFYALLRRVAGLRALPAGGADFFLIDRSVVRELERRRERPVNLIAQTAMLGFHATEVAYDRRKRRHGVTSWTLARKLRLAAASFAAVHGRGRPGGSWK